MGFLSRLLENAEWAVAGLIGSVVASRWHREDLKTWWDVVLFLFTGVACAYYGTGPLSDYYHIESPRYVGGVAFMLGAFGGSVIAAITRTIAAADLWPILKGLLNKYLGGGQ